MIEETNRNIVSTLFYILLIYISAECIAKLLHEFGHAGYAIFKGSNIKDIMIHVNPFSGGFTRVKSLNLMGNSDIYLFGLSGAFLPVLIGLFVIIRTINSNSISVLKWALLGGYGLLGNGVNLLAGVLIKSSDGGGLLAYGFSLFALIGIRILLSGLGTCLLVNKFFKISLLRLFKSKFDRMIFLFTLYIPACLSLLFSLILHDSLRRRILFSGIEFMLFSILFIISLRMCKKQEKDVESVIIPKNEWVIVVFGVIISVYCLVDYGTAIFYALSGDTSKNPIL